MDLKNTPVTGAGYTDRYLSETELYQIVMQSFADWNVTGQRLLFIIPDGTRTAPLPLLFRIFHELLSGKVRALDYLIALGTHQPMSPEAINRLLGVQPEEWLTRYSDVHVFNHRWDLPETFTQLGVITTEETRQLSSNMLSLEVPVRINRLVMEYDLVIVCGPVFPHEVVGFSGGSKYFFPGVSGPEVINFTHWLGALITSYSIIGTQDTPVRQAIERAAALIPTPRRCFSFVVHQGQIAGLFSGSPQAAWAAAAGLSSKLHIQWVERPFHQVISVMPEMFDDIWTGAKGMYKLEPVIADGGELILYAPHITEISYTHGKVIDEIGYHVRDYFLKQWQRFQHYPWGVLAHSTHLRGIGAYENGIEMPRVQVTLATGIPPERCARVNLGYRDPADVHPAEYANRESEGILLVPHAGEILYRLQR